jgi:hypothetical protein
MTAFEISRLTVPLPTWVECRHLSGYTAAADDECELHN